MKNFLLVLTISLCCTLFASDQEVTLLVSKPHAQEGTQYYPNYRLTLEPTDPVAFGLRYGYDMVGFGPSKLQLQLTYHAKSSTDIKRSTGSNYYFVESSATLKNEGFSAGVQAQWRYILQLGIGAELRYEKLEMGYMNTSQIRPWITTRVGFSVPSPGVHPVFGFEFAIPITKQKDPAIMTDPVSYGIYSEPEGVLKSLSPRYEISLYGGVRF
ncbi:MAG: hypothetical protein IPP78_15725 [Holophagaceae bacterium]|nr:hypothetical protein [Holophagaceae bacterium]